MAWWYQATRYIIWTKCWHPTMPYGITRGRPIKSRLINLAQLFSQTTYFAFHCKQNVENISLSHFHILVSNIIQKLQVIHSDKTPTPVSTDEMNWWRAAIYAATEMSSENSITGCPREVVTDNCQCGLSLWWKFGQNDNISVSVCSNTRQWHLENYAHRSCFAVLLWSILPISFKVTSLAAY